MKQFFLVSRFSDDIYSYIVNQCYLDIKKTDKNHIEIENIKLRRFPDLKFLFFCLFCLFKGDFFKKEKIIYLKFQKINFGKHLLSYTFRSYKSYLSSFTYYYALFKNIYLVAKYFKTSDYYINNYKFKYAYLDHIEYLNAIFYQKFVNKNIKIYSNRFPRSIIKTKQKNIEKLFEIEFKKKSYTKKQSNKIIKSSKKIFSSLRNYLPWMHYTRYRILKNKDLKNYEYIIYAHSFTDSQLEHKYDGFANTLEWLAFTVNELKKKNKNFIIKAHPNFYMKSTIKGIYEVAAWDKKIYDKFIKNLVDDKRILILDKPILNYDVATRLNKKCIVITKHGSAQLEMVYHNFKVITSKSNFINSKYSISNTWSNKFEYKKLLKKDWDSLKLAKKKNFYSVMENLFMDENKAYGKNHYLNVLKSHMSKLKLIPKNSSYEEMILKFNKIKNKDDIWKKIDLPILEV